MGSLPGLGRAHVWSMPCSTTASRRRRRSRGTWRLWRRAGGRGGARAMAGRPTIVLHHVKGQPHQVGKQEIVLGEVPCSVADGQPVGGVGHRTGRRQRVGRRHGGGGLGRDGPARRWSGGGVVVKRAGGWPRDRLGGALGMLAAGEGVRDSLAMVSRECTAGYREPGRVWRRVWVEKKGLRRAAVAAAMVVPVSV